MTRAELLKSADYWKAKIQIALYNCADLFMSKTGKNRKQLAEYLGVSNGYVTQLLNGDYDHKLSKLAELALAFGYVPNIEFIPIEHYIEVDKCRVDYTINYRQIKYTKKIILKACNINMGADSIKWSETKDKINKEAA